jgi:hypothetical protein
MHPIQPTNPLQPPSPSNGRILGDNWSSDAGQKKENENTEADQAKAGLESNAQTSDKVANDGNQNETKRDINDSGNSSEWPKNPDDWTPPDGITETPTGKITGGEHRQWKDSDGNIVRRWDKDDAPGGKKRGAHWHDSQGHHILPGGKNAD